MTHTRVPSRGALALVTVVAALSGCTTSQATTATPGGAPANAAIASGASAGTATGGAPDATPGSTVTALSCGTPPKALVERASASIAAHPGPITATTYVFAATTDTGDWYVLGLDRTYVHDDGTPVPGPDGDHSRSLALTNPARTTDGSVAMIPLSVAVSERLPVSWDRVSWTGDTLEAGRRAADKAIACLEAQRPS